MIVLYENTDDIGNLPNEFLPDVVYRQSMAGQFLSFNGKQIPYIGREDFNALGEDTFVIIGCRSSENIDKAISYCKKLKYRYELISNYVFKPFTITAKEISERYKGEYKDAFNNVIHISTKKRTTKIEFAFSLKCTEENFISNNNIYIADDADIENIKVEIGSSFNVLKIGSKTNIADLFVELNAGSKITIGDGCFIDDRCHMSAGTKPFVCEEGSEKPISKSQTIEIGDNVYLRGGNYVVGDCVIPSGCVVGFNTPIESKFTNENALIKGNPAREEKVDIVWKR